MGEMQHRVFGQLFVLVHGTEAPGDREWDAYLQDLSKLRDDVERVATLVVTAGGSPSTAQRKRLNDILAGRPTRAAVVSDNFMARCTVTALSWFNPAIKAFAPKDLDSALAYLELGDGRSQEVIRAVGEMRAELRA